MADFEFMVIGKLEPARTDKVNDSRGSRTQVWFERESFINWIAEQVEEGTWDCSPRVLIEKLRGTHL